jgi:hypothetical protein
LKLLAPVAFFWSKAPSAVCVLIRSDRLLSLWLLRGGVVSTWLCCCGHWTPRSRLSGAIARQTASTMLPLTYLRLLSRTGVATRFTGAVCCRCWIAQSAADVFAFLLLSSVGCAVHACAQAVETSVGRHLRCPLCRRVRKQRLALRQNLTRCVESR